MILQIKHFPSNNIIAETGEFTDSESFMDIKSLAVKIDSPTKLIFTPYNGGSYNYIDYNNNRYYLFIDPTTKDDNKSGKFTYNFNFKGFEYILKLIPFIDIVKAGGNTTYTNGGIVSFFGGTATIRQFLNASLETYFGNNTTWQVVEDFSDAFEPTMYPDQYFSLINQSCWDAVTSIKDVLGINYFIDTPIGGVSKIRITDKTATLPYVFRQGDGDGLYSIGKTISNEEELLTVIRPTGGNRNIRPGYKKDSKPADTSRYSPYLLLPDVNGFLQYEIRKEESIKKYGVRTKSVSDPFQGIFPSIQNATLGDVYGTPLPVTGNDGVSLSGLKSTDRIDRLIGSDFDAKSIFITVYVTDIGFNLEKKENDKYVYYTAEDSVISMRTGLYAGQEFKIQEGKVVQLDSAHSRYANGARYSIVLERNEDGTDADGNPMLVPTEPLVSGDFFAILGIYPPDVYYKIAERRLFNAATEWLNKYSVPQYTIPIDIAVSYFIEHPEEFVNFRAGNRLKVWGEDIDVNIESFTIQTYSLQYTKDNPYPKYSVTLSEVKEMGLLDRLNAISNASSQNKSEQKYGVGGGGGSGGVPEIDVTDRRYLRKDIPDVAIGYIDFQEGLNAHKKSIHEKGLQIGKQFAPGIAGGFGGLFDEYSNGEIESLKIRRFLEVPELRFNRVIINIGDDWHSPGGGIIEMVQPDITEEGVELLTGTIKLRLEAGEYGTVAVDDICMGIFHNVSDPSTNSTNDLDDGRGNRKFKGFYTAYFRITEILELDNSRFRYAVRGTSDRWSNKYHPCDMMTFVSYGNFTNKERQTSRYATRTYERYLKDVNTWEFSNGNIAAQFGDLTNLSIFGIEMSGYSAYLNNIFATGTIRQITPDNVRLDVTVHGDNFMGYGETKLITSVVYADWADVTDKVNKWSIKRDSGYPINDNAWNLDHLDFNGTIWLEYSDLGGDEVLTSSTLFTITAQGENIDLITDIEIG